jgi:NitT/TauT family transport system substrate-binding protein
MRGARLSHIADFGLKRLLQAAIFVIVLAIAAGCVPVAPATPLAGSTPARKLVIYAPATPASIPVLLAARHIEGAEVTIFTNHAQANAQFLRGEVDILVTGLSVGLELFNNGAPVQIIDSYVAGMTYLVTRGQPVESVAELRGRSIYLPFEGSPTEEVTRFFVEQAGLQWGTDVQPIYAPFTSSVELLKQGRADVVVLPEPLVSLIEGQPDLHVSLSYRELWDTLTGSSRGYPQVTPFVTHEWAAANADLVDRFNAEIAAALKSIEADPAGAVAQTHEALSLPEPVLVAALSRTDFAYIGGAELAEAIRGYYEAIRKPLDATYDAFFYRDSARAAQ